MAVVTEGPSVSLGKKVKTTRFSILHSFTMHASPVFSLGGI